MLAALAFLLSVSLAGAPLSVAAKVEDDAIYTEEGYEDYQAELSRNKAQAVETNLDPAWPHGPAIGAAGAVVMDADSGAVLYGKNKDKPLYPASITKLMTALLAYENLDPDDTVTFTENAVFGIEFGSSNIGMDVGESITVDEALYGLMVASANEVAIALGERISGTESSFIKLMNQRAIELGCKNTHFVTPNGLHDSDHYTTAYDMALIGREIFKHPDLIEYMSKLNYHFIPSKNQPDDFWILNTNDFLNNEIEYDGIVGGKTGYTDQARETLVSFAERDGKKLICVIMREEPPFQYFDTVDLLNYAFDNFKQINISGQEDRFTQTSADFLSSGPDIFGKSNSSFYINEDAKLMIPNTVSFSDLTAEITPAPYKPAGQEDSTQTQNNAQETNPETPSGEESSDSSPAGTASTASTEQAAAEESSPENSPASDFSSLSVNGDKVIGIIHYKFHDYDLGSANVLFRSSPAVSAADSAAENADIGSTAASADLTGSTGVPTSVHGIKSLLFSLIHTGAHGSVYLNILLLMPLLLAATFLLCILIFVYDYFAQRSPKRRKQMRRAQRANRLNSSGPGENNDANDTESTPRSSEEKSRALRNTRKTGSSRSSTARRRTSTGTRTNTGQNTAGNRISGNRFSENRPSGNISSEIRPSGNRSSGNRSSSNRSSSNRPSGNRPSGNRSSGASSAGRRRTTGDTRYRYTDRSGYDSRTSKEDYNRNRPSR